MVDLLDKRVERLIASARSASAACGAAATQGGAASALALAASPLPVPSKLPLVRLRIDYTDVTTLSSAKLAARYVGRVANPGDLFLWHKARRGLGGRPAGGARLPAIPAGREGGDAEAGLLLQAPPPPAELDDRAIASLVAEHLSAAAEAPSGGGEFLNFN